MASNFSMLEVSSFPLIKSEFSMKPRSSLPIGSISGQLDHYAADQIDNLKNNLNRKCVVVKFHEKENRYEFKVDGYDALILGLNDLIEHIENADPSDDKSSFTDLFNKTGNADLFSQVSQIIDPNKISYNANKLLSEKPILGYLFWKAVYYNKLKTPLAIYNYITNDVDGGIKLFYDYITIKAAVKIKEDNKFETDHDQFKAIKDKLRSTNFSFVENTFEQSVLSFIKDQIFDNNYYGLIEGVKDKLNINIEDYPALINYIKHSKVKIDTDNAELFLSIALNEIRNASISYLPGTTTDITDADFSVNYYEDEKGTLEIVHENIAAAAQMFYIMTLGDELEIFNVINRIVTKYLPSGQIDIRSNEILKDLQLYVFNDSFRDLKSGVIYKRTHPEERKMFYRQVFNAGGGEIMEGMVVNGDFITLWEKLLVECVKYIEKIEKSENPSQFISKNGIIHAVEDLQYNLSTHCTGMAKVASPIINKELDFVVERFLKNSELIKQLAVGNSSSFWKVIERVLADLRNEVPNVSALRSKAYYGHQVITHVSKFTPRYFEDQNIFSDFISTVDALIIACSQSDYSIDSGILGTGNNNREEQPSQTIAGQEENAWNF